MTDTQKSNKSIYTIDKNNVHVHSNPFSYVQINKFSLRLERISPDPEDVTMDLDYDILTGEWLPHESHDLVLSISTKDVPKDLLLDNEKAISPTTSFLNVNRRHKFFTVNNERVVVSQPYKNTSNSTTLTITFPSHKYPLTRVTSPALNTIEYIDECAQFDLVNESAPLTSKYGMPTKYNKSIIHSSGKLSLSVKLSNHEARKTLSLSGLNFGLRVLGGDATYANFKVTLEKLPSLAIAMKAKSFDVDIKISRKALWDKKNKYESSNTYKAQLILNSNQNELHLVHLEKDIEKLQYLTPGYDYKIEVVDSKINYF